VSLLAIPIETLNTNEFSTKKWFTLKSEIKNVGMFIIQNSKAKNKDEW